MSYISVLLWYTHYHVWYDRTNFTEIKMLLLHNDAASWFLPRAVSTLTRSTIAERVLCTAAAVIAAVVWWANLVLHSLSAHIENNRAAVWPLKAGARELWEVWRSQGEPLCSEIKSGTLTVSSYRFIVSQAAKLHIGQPYGDHISPKTTGYIHQAVTYARMK
jgi:hypothetical protein